jgi:hypothetical protein
VHRSILLAFLTLGVTAGSATAAPVAYDEATDGDLDYGFVGTLDVGANTVSGSVHYDNYDPFDDADVDLFWFEVPVGAELTAISFAYSASFDNVGGASIYYQLDEGLADRYIGLPYLTDSSFPLQYDASPVSLFADVLPLAAGNHGFTAGSVSLGCLLQSNPLCGWQADYTFTLTVVPIPEPQVSVLVGAGLAVVAYGRRRRVHEVRLR